MADQEAPSDEVISQETLSQRNNIAARPLFIRRDGVINIPEGAVLNALRGRVLLPGTLLDNIPLGNIIQAPDDYNITVGSDVLHSTVLGSEDVTLGNGDSADEVEKATILGSTSVSLDGSAFSNGVYGSGGITFDPAGFSIPTGIGLNFWNNFVAASNACTLSGQVHGSTLLGSQDCDIVATGTLPVSHRVFKCGIYNSIDSNITSTSTQAYSAAIIASQDSDIANTAFVRNRLIAASENCTISGSANSAFVGAANGNITNCNSCLAVGTGSTMTGRVGSFALNATPTRSSQAAIGADLRVSGIGNNATVVDGYAYADRGFIGNYVEDVNEVEHFLSYTNTRNIQVGDIANGMPLGTTKALYFYDRSGGSFCNFVGGTGINNVPGFVRHRSATGCTMLVHEPPVGSPYVTYAHPMAFSYSFRSTTANNFGASNPQTDANQLPTTADRAAHDALAYTTRYKFQTATISNDQVLNLVGDEALAYITGEYKFSYYFIVSNGGAGGSNYLLRSSLMWNGVINTVPGSYAETGGVNSLAGTRRVDVVCEPFRLTTPAPPGTRNISLKISQDTTNTIDVLADIIEAGMTVEVTI